MKSVLLSLLLGTACLPAAEIRLAWDANPATDRVTGYLLRYGTDPAKLAESRKLENIAKVTLDLEPGIYHFELVAVSASGVESDPSERITHTVRPERPRRVRVVEIQTSSNLKDWKTVAWVPLEESAAPAGFVRAGLRTVEP